MTMPDHPLPSDITNVLARLRGRIQTYVLIEGVASILAVLGGLFWLSLGLDWSYFWIQRADLPLGIRVAIEVAGAGLCLSLLFVWVAIRYFRGFRQRALALVLERRFPELNDRLITAIELGERTSRAPPLSKTMLARTIEEARDASSRLDLSTVFSKRPLLRAGLSAACMSISILTFALCYTDVFETWFRRNVLLKNEGWQRLTALEVVVQAQPDDREVAFQNLPEFKYPTYKHPRGSDLKILASILPDKQVPGEVQFRYVQDDGTRGRRYMSQLGQNQFKDTLDKVTRSLDFHLIAGDAYRETYHVEVVDPPRIDEFVLQARYPEYTGLNKKDEATGPDGRIPKPVLGTQVSLEVGTDFLLTARTNKRLVKVRVQTASYVLDVSREKTQLTLFEQSGKTRGGVYAIPDTETWITEDGLGFSIPFLLGDASRQNVTSENHLVCLPAVVAPPFAAPLLMIVPPKVLLPLRLPPNGELQITLTDEDDIRGTDVSKLVINSIEDKIPEFDVQRKGVTSSITSKAVLPFIGKVTDDYGIVQSHFLYKVGDQEAMQRSFPVSPNGRKTFELRQSENQAWLRFDVKPLDLTPGQKLAVSVQAIDGDNVSGPHSATSENFNFEIVTDAELNSKLFTREYNLRLRLEQIIKEVERTQLGLILARQQVKDLQELESNPPPATSAAEPPGTPKSQAEAKEKERQEKEKAHEAKLKQLDIAIKDSAERALFDVRKNQPETEAIARNLEDIRDEKINNGVDTPTDLERLNGKLIKPLNVIQEKDFGTVDRRLGLFRLDLQENRSPLEHLDESIQGVDLLKRNLEKVLKEMKRMETQKAMIERLKVIKAMQEAVNKRTDLENKRSIITNKPK